MTFWTTDLLSKLRREVSEDEGRVPTKDRPACPECKLPLVCVYGRHSKVYRIVHGGGSSIDSCRLRLEDFAHGNSEEEAWKNLKL